MSQHPLVSIIIPCYNVENYIEECINSVFNQDYTNWECIIINDGSRDNTYEIIKSFDHKDSRIKIITQNNAGLSATRNKGIEIANGEFLFFLDSDDILSFDAISSLVASLDNNDIITGVTVVSRISNDSISKISQLYPPKEGNITYANKHSEVLIKTIESALTPVAQNRLYRSSFINSQHLRFKKGILHEDELWFFETMLLAKNVKFIDHETYFYRTNNEDSITRKLNDKNLESYIAILEEIYQKYILRKDLEIAQWYNIYMKKIIIDFAIREQSKLSTEVINKLEKCLQSTYTELPAKSSLSKMNEKYYRALNKLSRHNFDIIKKHFFRNPVNSSRKNIKLLTIFYLVK